MKGAVFHSGLLVRVVIAIALHRHCQRQRSRGSGALIFAARCHQFLEILVAQWLLPDRTSKPEDEDGEEEAS